jgi:sulfate permease, SulP family
MFSVRGEPILTAIQKNVGSGLTVALVNIPLSISLAVASDASPSMGCVTVIWAGAICAFLGGSHFNIVGPTGALSGLLSIASVQFGQDVLPLLAIMSGILSMIVFATNMDKLALFVPANTMQGFTIAVAVIIACNQINFALGLDKVPRHPSFVDNVIENLNHAGATEWQAVVMFVSFLSGQIILSRIFPRIPWAIVMACIGMLLGYLSGIDGVMSYKIRTLDSRYPGLSLSLFSFPSFKPDYFMPQTFYVLFLNALSITFVAILETLISAKWVFSCCLPSWSPFPPLKLISMRLCFSGSQTG